MIVLMKGVREKRRLLHRRELPPIGKDADVQASERSLFASAPQLTTHTRILLTRGSAEIAFENVEDLSRSRAALIHQHPPQVLNALPHLVQVRRCPGLALLGLALVGVHKDVAEGVDGEAIDQRRHCIHTGDEHKLDAVLPPEDLLEKRPDPLQQLALACSWDALSQRSQGLGDFATLSAAAVSSLKLGLHRASVQDVLQHSDLLWIRKHHYFPTWTYTALRGQLLKPLLS